MRSGAYETRFPGSAAASRRPSAWARARERFDAAFWEEVEREIRTLDPRDFACFLMPDRDDPGPDPRFCETLLQELICAARASDVH